MKRIFLLFSLLSPLTLCAGTDTRDTISIQRKKPLINYVGARFGGLTSSFSHNDGVLAPLPGKGSLPAWHAGIALDLLAQKNYNARIELSYLNKGARETFENARISIQNKNRLQYIQISALPLVIRPNFKKINPYFGLGAFYSRRIGIKSKSKTGQGTWANDPVTADNLNIKNDFGYSVSAGIYVRKRPLCEIRYEAGLPSVSATSRIKNRSIVLSFFI